MAEQLTAQDSRQGKCGKPALVVLITSVGLMLVALAGLMAERWSCNGALHASPWLRDDRATPVST